MRVLDDRGNVVPDGVVGHIAVKRARQPQHYLDDDRGQTFIDGYFMTGDTGHLRGDQLYLAGRVSEIINAAGIKVDPARVEAAAYDFPGVQDAAVCGYTDATGLETIALVFVSETPVVIDDLVALMRSRLGESAPRHVARVEKIPRTDSGKVMRDEVARLFTQRLALP